MCIWDKDKKDLMILFNSKAAWFYKNVSEDIYNKFITSDSAGKFFNENIRNNLNGVCLYKKGQLIEQEAQ